MSRPKDVVVPSKGKYGNLGLDVVAAKAGRRGEACDGG